MGKKVALDDGHGMQTLGKRTPKFADGTFMHENEFNREVVKLTKTHLIRCGIDVVLVAPTDDDVALEVRAKIANDAKADLYVSVHANAMTGIWGSSSGIETFCYTNSSQGKIAADIIHKYLLKGTKLKDRGVKKGSFYVLKYTNMPAVLVECGFMDNHIEAVLLKTNEYREECAEELAKGICEYFKIIYIVDKNIAENWKAKYIEMQATLDSVRVLLQTALNKMK